MTNPWTAPAIEEQAKIVAHLDDNGGGEGSGQQQPEDN
ncbi:MAG: hypothetical protein QOJ62_1802 [Actinomycetota bacterium]|nr:hypothetical protein [Actinomycetota bacterium]